MITNGNWRAEAACAQVGGDVFFPEGVGSAPVKQITAICAACPVKAECLQYALEISPEFGWWAGLPAYKIRRIRNAA